MLHTVLLALSLSLLFLSILLFSIPLWSLCSAAHLILAAVAPKFCSCLVHVRQLHCVGYKSGVETKPESSVFIPLMQIQLKLKLKCIFSLL